VFWKDQYWKRVCLDCFKASKRKERQYEQEKQPTQSTDLIPADVLKKLMYLCHPDKHGGSRVASDMFVWLSGFKK
jgi:hypothetical protein